MKLELKLRFVRCPQHEYASRTIFITDVFCHYVSVEL